MTFEEVRHAALSRLMDYDGKWPTSRSALYRRIGVRQQQLFAIVAREAPQYNSQSAYGLVVDGRIEFASMTPMAPKAETIQLVVIAEPGESGYAPGQHITFVTIDDPRGLAPRAFVNRGGLEGVGSDLAKVDAVKAFYSYMPEPTSFTEGGSREVEIPDPYSELLVVDLAKDMTKKTVEVNPELKAAVVGMFNEEEAALLSDWIVHVRNFVPMEKRFRKVSQ